MKYICKLHTNGKGLWSVAAKEVRINSIELDGSELIVGFDRSWNVAKDGLIYSDPLFIKELRVFLKKKKITGKVDYSEQGMQGDSFVSLDYCPSDYDRIKKLNGARKS